MTFPFFLFIGALAALAALRAPEIWSAVKNPPITHTLKHALSSGWKPKEVMRAIISLVVLAAALFVVLSHKYDAGAQKWAYGALGTILGHWLK